MSINYTCFSALDCHRSRELVDMTRQFLNDQAQAAILITEPSKLGIFDREILSPYGFSPKSRFGLHVQDKARLRYIHPMVELLYQVFGTKRLLVLWGMDSVVNADRQYPGYPTG